jgi:peptidoglycan/LPS O-acetylase OafA/YrhL
MTGNAAPAVFAGENRPLTSIRGVASLWVFSAHVASCFYPVMPHRLAIGLVCGWLGVDLFFVLSGFILASVYAALVPAQWGRFWVKRALRVFPLNTALMAFLVVCALLGIRTGARVDWPDLPWHFLMLQSFVPEHRTGWLFVNWSVGIELICYAAFPLLALGMRGLGRGALMLAALAVAALTYDWQLRVLGSFFGSYAVMRCGSEFLLGAVAGTLALRLPRLPPVLAGTAEFGALAALLVGVSGGLGAEWCAALGSRRMACVPLAAAALIFALASDTGPMARLLRWGPLFWLGQISFSLYLIHWPLMSRMAVFAWLWSGGPPTVAVIAAWGVLVLALGLALSALTYRFIELPGRRLGAGLIARGALVRAKPS